MYFLIDHKLKIIFGWSAKCGCSHIKKIFWYLQTDDENHQIHTNKDISNLPTDIRKYITIIIIRNPYERIISGFLEKYNEHGILRKTLWKHSEITFSKFITELLKNDWKMIDKHHFTPQTTEFFDNNKILKSKQLKIYDIKNIDYNFIENLYNKKIPENVLNFRGGHERKTITNYDNYVYDLDMKLYYDYKIPIKYFYSKDIKNIVFNFYKNDFTFFLNNGFNYVLETD